jgi:hypothetical protein
MALIPVTVYTLLEKRLPTILNPAPVHTVLLMSPEFVVLRLVVLWSFASSGILTPLHLPQLVSLSLLF